MVITTLLTFLDLERIDIYAKTYFNRQRKLIWNCTLTFSCITVTHAILVTGVQGWSVVVAHKEANTRKS